MHVIALISTHSRPAGPAVFRGMRIFMSCRGIRRLPQNLLIAAENEELSVFATYLIQGLSGSFLTFDLSKTIKSSRCKLTFMIIMSIMT